ncbi:MAG: aldo/keto reductase [Acidimicrobiales bacterium]
MIGSVQVTRLGLGGTSLGGLFEPTPEDSAYRTVARAYELGIRFFDTAPLYGYGSSERRLGHAIGSLPRATVTVATKVGRLLRDTTLPGASYDIDTTIFCNGEPLYKDTGREVPIWDFSYDGALRSLEESLVRLDVDHVDLVHVHDPDDHLDEAISGACQALIDLRDQGIIGAVGVGIDHSRPAARFVRESDIDCVLIAGRWTLLDHEALDELLPLALNEGVKVIACGVFNSGVLASDNADATFDYAPAPPEIRQRVQRMALVCRRHGVPLKAAALQFAYRHPAVAAVLVGTRSPERLEECVALSEVAIPEELWSDLSEECHVPLLQ